MGGLINTKGTRKLAAHFNNEFSTYIDFYRTLQATVTPPPPAPPAPDPHFYTLFDVSGWPTGQVDLLTITTWVQDNRNHNHSRRPDNLCLLPDDQHDPGKHPNLDARWQWFLNVNNANAGNRFSPYALSQGNHNVIAADILYGLQNTAFNSISFDVKETGSQSVTRSTQSDSVNGTSVQILQILLNVVGPIPAGPLAAAAPMTALPALDGPPY